MDTIEQLYFERNKLLNIATSYRDPSGNNSLTQEVRTDAFLEAISIKEKMQKIFAEQYSNYIPPNFNLYREDGTISHMLISDNGINRKYVKIENWRAEDVELKDCSPYERFIRHEGKDTNEEKQFQRDLKRIKAILLNKRYHTSSE
jgi:hypothetical protein